MKSLLLFFVFLLSPQLLSASPPTNTPSPPHSGGAIFWDPEYESVTTTNCNASDTAQHWILNGTKIWSAKGKLDGYNKSRENSFLHIYHIYILQYLFFICLFLTSSNTRFTSSLCFVLYTLRSRSVQR